MQDIVARLREVGCNREPFTPEHAQCKCRLANEAANEIERLRASLGEIMKGEGRFSRDRFEHAQHTIEDMKQLARDALGETVE